jgi:transposase
LRSYITFEENKVYCKCGFKGNEKLDFVEAYSRCTVRFEEYIFMFCPVMSLNDIHRIFGIDWKTVKDIDIRYTTKALETLKNITPKRIGVDEIAFEKGQSYLTIVRDLDLGKVIWIGFERKKETLDRFFDELGREKSEKIEVVVMDMWDPYIASVNEHCPAADIVFDKFHIVKTVNVALDKVRKEQFADASDEERKNMKRKRFIILRREENLNEKQHQLLEELKQKNEPLYQAYLLKEHICELLDGTDLDVAVDGLDIWKRNVEKSGFKPFAKCLNTIKNYFYGVLNYFRHLVTNAGSEGFNNKINLIKRRAYGYADPDYFKLKIFQACGLMKSNP